MPAPISKEKKAAILADIRKGDTTCQLMFKHHCSPLTILLIKMRHGIKGNAVLGRRGERLEQIKQYISAGKTCTDIMNKFHCGLELIHKLRLSIGLPVHTTTQRKRLTKDQQKTVIKLLGTRTPMAHIARAAGVSTKTVAIYRDEINGVERNIKLDAKRRGERI